MREIQKESTMGPWITVWAFYCKKKITFKIVLEAFYKFDPFISINSYLEFNNPIDPCFISSQGQRPRIRWCKPGTSSQGSVWSIRSSWDSFRELVQYWQPNRTDFLQHDDRHVLSQISARSFSGEILGLDVSPRPPWTCFSIILSVWKQSLHDSGGWILRMARGLHDPRRDRSLGIYLFCSAVGRWSVSCQWYFK